VLREFSPTRIASFGCDTTSPASGRGEASPGPDRFNQLASRSSERRPRETQMAVSNHFGPTREAHDTVLRHYGVDCCRDRGEQRQAARPYR
jgi:hypothetical protein